jgi:hypothetical protein
MPKSPEKPTFDERRREDRGRRGDAQVARRGQRQAGAGRRAADHRDGRLLDLMQQARGFHRASQRIAPFLVGIRGIAMPARRSALAQVAAGAEASARAAQDDRPDVGIARRALQLGLQLDYQRGIERVQRIRTVECQRKDAVLEAAEAPVHCRSWLAPDWSVVAICNERLKPLGLIVRTYEQ